MNHPPVQVHALLTLNAFLVHASAKLVITQLKMVNVSSSLATTMSMIAMKFLSIHHALERKQKIQSAFANRYLN